MAADEEGQLPYWLAGGGRWGEGVRLSPTEERVWCKVAFVSTRGRESGCVVLGVCDATSAAASAGNVQMDRV